jgi:hypothetical protein
MARRIWLLWGALAITTTASGCITQGYEGLKLAYDAGINSEIPVNRRNLVYIFVLGGDNPFDSGIDGFRRGLNAQGYGKVATAPSIYYWWMADEMKRIHKENPNAVFVIAGLDSSASLAQKLSDKVSAEGVPVDGLVIVDPSGKTPSPRRGLRTIMVSTGFGITSNVDVESLVITTPGEHGLSGDQRTIVGVAQLLDEIALQNALPGKEEASAWVYPFAVESPFSVNPKPDSEWSFMFDRPGGATRAIEDPVPILTQPGTSPATPGTSTIANTTARK